MIHTSELRSALLLAICACAPMGTRASAQAPRVWQTPAGGDASGAYLAVSLREDEVEIRGTRRVERVDAPSGYRTGTSATIVLEGPEPETARSIRVHLPYGASLDLAAGETVEVEARSRRVGLGSRAEVLLTRGGEIVILSTSRDRAGVTVARGAPVARDGSRRTYEVRATIGGRPLVLRPEELLHLRDRSLLAQAHDVAYEGRVRPPDAFDSRLLMLVRIRAPR